MGINKTSMIVDDKTLYT